MRALLRRVWQGLAAELPPPPAADAPPERFAERHRVAIVLLTSTVFLSMLWHWGRLPFYRAEVGPLLLADADPATFDFYGYWFLAAASIVTRMLLPLAVIVFVFRQRPAEYGYRVRGTRGLAWIYLGLLALMVPLLYVASGQAAFQQKYPLYDYASDSLSTFVVYELSYVLVFLSGESFWRGFMVFGLAPKLGLYSLIVMAIPYAMVHFGKPFPEALGAILTGVVLGWLALKHQSFWLGVALHSSIGIVMDLMCLWRKGELGPLLGL